MVLQVSEVFTSLLLVTDANGNVATGKTINYRVFDENLVLFESGTMDEVAGYGIYYKSWTPDAEGYWIFEAYYTGSDFRFYSIKSYAVRKGVEKSLYDSINNGTYGLSALNTDLDAIIAELANGTYGLAAIEALVDEVESLLKNATYGLSALKTEIDANETKIDNVDSDLGTHDVDIKALLNHATYGLAELQLEIAALENKLKASPSVDSILFKAGGAVCPSGKSVWDALGDATVSLNTLNSLLTNATYGLSALETLVDEVESLLKDATFGLSALNADLDDIISKIGSPASSLAADIAAIENKLKAAPSVDSILFKSGGAVCPAGKSIWDALGAGTNDLDDIFEVITDVHEDTGDIMTDTSNIKSNIGSFQGQTYLKSILAALGIPDVSGKPLYTCLITDRLDNGTYGLSALKTLIDAIQTDLDNPDQYKADVSALALEATLGTHDTDIKALLEHGTYGLSAIETLIDEVESMLKDGTYGLSALNVDLDAIIAELANGTYGLAAIKAYVDSLETWLGNPSGDTLTTITAKLGDNATAIGVVTDKLNALVQATGAVTGTPTANFFDTDLTEATDDHYNGSIIIFTSGNLIGQASIIVDYDGTTKEITVDPAFIETPSTDNFAILSNPLGALRTGSKGLEQIYDFIDTFLKLGRIGDTLTTDGNEQTLFIQDAPAYKFKPIKFLIDTTAHTATETIVLRVYLRLKSGGNYIEFDELTLVGAQDPLGVSLDLYPNLYGIKITIEKTGGTNRSYDYEIWIEER